MGWHQSVTLNWLPEKPSLPVITAPAPPPAKAVHDNPLGTDDAVAPPGGIGH